MESVTDSGARSPQDAPGSPPAARVALPVPLDRLFDYAVPAALDEAARPGCRVVAPFSGRRLTGVVVERVRETETGSLAALQHVVDPEPALSPELLEVLREEAEAALCPLGQALAAALPAGSAPRAVQEWHATPRGREALERGAVRGDAGALLDALVRRPATPDELKRRHPGRGGALKALERDGLAARRPALRGPAAREASVRVARLAARADPAQLRQLARAPRQIEVLRRLDQAGGELPAASLRAAEALRALERRGLVTLEERRAPRALPSAWVSRDRPVELTDAQREALIPVERAVRERRAERFLLHGVTGSGKTEVYLRAVAAALERGRQALVLVPEITLTHQIVARLRARFGDALAVLHSGLRPGERLEQWQRLRRGEVPIAVGARSALFAPLESVGLIVIDEEHDSAYKNEEGFRYHARDLAARRARAAGCPVLLGSATPSLETRYEAERGDVRRLVLPRRIGGRPLPAVEIVDLARERERAPRGRKLIVTRPLRRALQETLAQGGQAIVFLNRRGFSTQILCFECGKAERCKDCDVALVYHAAEQRLRCHYCDYAVPPPEACSGCGAPDAALLGLGTERVEEELRILFPDARIGRLDRDVARRRGATARILGELRAGRLDVLVGTQMVAKGHDFPGVRVVGVVAADLGLHLPDFRAAERTFQLLTQVAGRAGRDALPGRVVVQTFVPDHYALRPVRDHDYETFYAAEIEQRAALGYPPCGHLARALLSGEDEEEVARAAALLGERAREAAAGRGVEVLGPAEAPLPRLRRRHRHQLLWKGPDGVAVRDVARMLSALRVQAGALPAGVQVAIDVAPMSML